MRARASLLSAPFRFPPLAAAAGAAALWVFLALVAGPAFRSWAGTATILNAAAPLGILAAAVALLMIAGEFDLSIGATIGAVGLLMAGLIAEGGWDPAAAALAGLALALAIGAFNGVVVLRTGLPSFIVTLAVMFLLRGATIAVARAATGRTQLAAPLAEGGSSTALRAFLASDLAGLRVSILWWVGASALLAWLLRRTVSGNWILAAGGAPESARALGVPVRRVKAALFLLTASSAWLVALIQLLRFGGADALRGQGQEFHAIVAAVIGGALLTGGHGSVAGAAFGALIYGVARQGMVIAGVDADWFQAALGVLLLAAAYLNHRARAAATRGERGGTRDFAAPGDDARAPGAAARAGDGVAPAGRDASARGGAGARAAGAGNAVLEARGIARAYGGVIALRGASVSVRAGRVTCLVGDNGAGKSTLIRILAGIEPPDAGELLVDGRAVRFASPANARAEGVGVVLQTLAHAPLMSIWRNFVLGAADGRPLARLDPAASRAAARRALADLGMDLTPLDRPVAVLSGGERQALAIARALAGEPRVLVLDEPTAALGVAATEAVLGIVREARDRGVAALVVTHSPAQALALADDVVVLAHGRVVMGAPAGSVGLDRLRALMAGGAAGTAVAPDPGAGD